MPRQSQDETLRRVYREHVDAVFGFFAYSVGRSVAEDLAGNTFERVIRHWKRFDPARASERTWILAIARNVLIDHYRRESHRRSASLDEHPLLLESLAEQDDPLARSLAESAFEDWISGLGDRERQVLALRYGADLTAAAVAALLSLSEANVNQISSRALKKLRAAAVPDPGASSTG